MGQGTLRRDGLRSVAWLVVVTLVATGLLWAVEPGSLSVRVHSVAGDAPTESDGQRPATIEVAAVESAPAEAPQVDVVEVAPAPDDTEGASSDRASIVGPAATATAPTTATATGPATATGTGTGTGTDTAGDGTGDSSAGLDPQIGEPARSSPPSGGSASEPPAPAERPTGAPSVPGPRSMAASPPSPVTGGGWAPATVAIVDPRDFGAVGDGVADDTDAVRRAIRSLTPAGGVVHIADGLTYRTTEAIRITGDHVKLWARSGRGGLTADTDGARVAQALVCVDNVGCGFHGLRLQSDSSRRLMALEDSRIALDGATGAEVVGVEISGSASAAVFVYGKSRQTWVEGNYLHHNWADGVHFTDGSRQAWVWDNTIYNDGVTKGDDGVACVTYGTASLCGEMEWWENTHLGSGWGRGLSVIGGRDIDIHHNLVRGVAAAGVLVASEPSYDTPGSHDIGIRDNVVYQTGRVVPHGGIQISALSAPVERVTVERNVVVDSANSVAFRREGDTASIVERGTVADASALPSSLPSIADGPRPRPTDVLKMRDSSFVAAGQRPGLYRHHIRPTPGGAGFEQRFEYVVQGPREAIERWARGAGATVRVFDTGGDASAIVLSASPLSLPAGLRGLGFAQLRSAGAADLWRALDAP